MARHITDAQRQVTLPLPEKRINWKRLMVWLIAACVVVGGSVGGYYALNKATPTATVQKPPVQPVPAPLVNQTPTQPSTPTATLMSVLEVKWERVQLPPLKSGMDGIMGFKVENSDTISVWRCISPADGGKATLVALWKTEDGCKTWKEVEQIVVYSEDEKRLGFIGTTGGNGEGYTMTPLLNEDEIPQQTINPLKRTLDPSTGGLRLFDKNGDKVFLITPYRPFDENLSYNQKPYSVFRMFLSTDAGKSWKALNWPSYWARFDRYPETPELTLLASGPDFPPGRDPNETDFVWGWPDTIDQIEIASSGDGSINLFMASAGYNGFIRGTIKSPN